MEKNGLIMEQKMYEINNYISHIPDNEIIVFFDAFDTFNFSKMKKKIIRKYKKIKQ